MADTLSSNGTNRSDAVTGAEVDASIPADTPPPISMSSSGGLKRIFHNLWMLLTGRAVNAPLALLHTYLAIRLLGDSDFGLVVMLYAYARTIGDIVDFQSWQTILHFGIKPLTDGKLSLFQRVIRFGLFLDIASGIAGAIMGLAGVWLFSRTLGWPPKLHTIGSVYCLSIIFMASATPTGVLRILNRYDLLAFQGTFATVVRLVGTVLLCMTGGGLAAMAAVWMAAEFFACALLFGLAWRELRSKSLTQFMWRRLPETYRDLMQGRIEVDFPGIWKFAFSTNFNSTLTLAFSHVGTLIVGSELGPVSAGYYRVANQIATGIAKPATLIQTTLYPEMARLWRDRAMKKLYRLSIQIALLAGLGGSALLLLAYFAGTPLLKFMLGPQGGNALPVMLWLLGAEVITIWGMPLEPLLITMRKAGAAILAKSLDVVLFLPCLVMMIRWHGLDGVGPATVISTLALIVMQFILVFQMHDRSKATQETAS